MALWVQIRRTFHPLTSVPKPIPTFPNCKFRFLSTKSNSPIPISNSSTFCEHAQYRKQVSLANLLQRYDFPRTQLQGFLTKNRFLLSWNVRDIEKSLGVLLSFKLSQNFLVSMICECPGVLELDFLKKWKTGFSKSEFLAVYPLMIQKVLEYSRRFQLDPNDFFRSVKVLRGFGLGDGTVANVLEKFPGVMMVKECELLRKIEFLLRIGISRDEIDRFCFLFPGILNIGVESRLKPLFEEFEKLGFSKDLVRKEIVREPRILGMELGELSRCLEFVRNLKCRVPIKEKILGEGVFRVGFEVKLRVDCLCKHGLIRREAFKVLWIEPRVIIYDMKDIEKKIDFLIHTMKFDVSWLVEVPEYLGVNFEKQIVPRYRVIMYLRSIGGLGCDVGLKGLIKLSRLRFYNLYVKPYPECEKLFGKLSRDAVPRNRHPTGLWMHFKPQRYPETEEDTKNMKSFMESLV